MTEGTRGGGAAQVSAAHVMAPAVVFAIPVLKLAWTLGGGDAARDALLAMGPANWVDVVIGMFFAEPVLAVVLAAVLSYIGYAYRAAHGGAARRQGRALAETAARAAILPGALGVVVGAFNGLWWGVAAGVLGYLLRLGVVAEYRTGARSADTGRRTGRTAVAFGPRAVEAVRVAALLLSLVVLPALSVVAALDGRSWTSVLMCDVDTGAGPQRARLVELDRQAPGVVGWDVPAHEVVSGTNCATDPDDVLRAPWWRR
ncbi:MULTISPECIES: hypothetical protein [Streptomycetaceae]|uniref:hypothetical protein n=1 Tax=Streptomycetaceae TaxID=2062 RepID=UPI0007C6E2D2|nr:MULTISPECIES: hypothetical protein [Streptomycetaceae]OKI03182.1 hypothetical protein AMK13_27185 [Streptomyces sp. CB02056]